MKTCPICHQPFSGRTDKKYCSDQCRAQANNEKKISNQYTLISTNQRLRKNRTILKTLCPHGKATVRKEVMTEMGFEFDFFTSLFFAKNSQQVYYLCYDFAYLPIMEGEIEKALIVTKQDYMKDWDPWKFRQRIK